MYFPDNPEMLNIIDSIKIHIFNDMDKGHYVCDVFYYNTGTWWNCDDETITQYPGYPMNVYNDLSIDKNKKWLKKGMDVSDMIVSTLYIRQDILVLRTY